MDLLLVGPDGVYAICEFFRLLVIGLLALHPDHIGVRCEGYRSGYTSLRATLESVEAFSCPRRIPVKVYVHSRQAFGDGPTLGIALAFGLFLVLLDQALFVDVHTRGDGICHGLAEELEVCLRVPCVFDGLELGSLFAGVLCGYHEVVEWLESWVGGAQDEAVIAVIDGAGDESGRFGIRPSNSEEIGACLLISHELCRSSWIT